jgi:membrane protein YqaA with SNARE-associated domain
LHCVPFVASFVGDGTIGLLYAALARDRSQADCRNNISLQLDQRRSLNGDCSELVLFKSESGAYCMNLSAQQPAFAPFPSSHHPLAPQWIMHLGVLGLFFIAVIDSSVIPLPLPGSTDLLLLWLVAHSGDPWLLAPCAISGSILGGYTTWHIGRRGGEAALRRYVPARLLDRVVRWVERHRILAVFLPALLPPPIPLLPFALASGALGVSRNRFLAVFGTARSLRYSFIAWLGVTYGRKVVRLFSGNLEKWSTPLLSVFVILLVTSIAFGIWKIRGLKKIDAAEKLNLQDKEARVE